MRKILAAIFSLFATAALAQGTGGPGPVPDPWTIVGNGNIQYALGSVVVGAPSGSSVTGAGNVDISGTYYVNGVALAAFPCTFCAVTNATNTFTAQQNFMDTTGGTLSLIRSEHYSAATGDYGIEVHNYADNPSSPTPGAGANTAIVIHQYSDLTGSSALQIDSTRSQPMISLTNSQNSATSAGTQGTSPYFSFNGYGLTTPTVRTQLGYLNDALVFGSTDPLVQFTFNNGLNVANANTQTTSALAITNLGTQSALSATTTSNTFLTNMQGLQNGGYYSTSTNGGTALTVVKNATGAGVGLAITNLGTGNSWQVSNSGGVVASMAANGVVGLTAGVASTSTSTGTLTVTGGVGVSGAIYAGAADIVSASATALAVGANGTTNPAFVVNSSTALQVAGLSVTGAVTGGTVALATIDSGSNTNLTINAKGTGTIGIGSVSTGAVTITPATTLSAALTYGGVTLSNSVSGTGSMVLNTAPSIAGGALSGTFSGTPTFSGANFVTLANIVQDATAWSLLGNATSGTANYAPFTVGALTNKTTPAGSDLIMIQDQAASGALKYATLTQAIGALASGVSSLGGSTGNMTVTGPLQVVGSTNGALSINATTTAHGLAIFEGTSAMANTGTGTTAQCINSNGASADPSFKSGCWVLLNTLTASNSATTLGDTSSITSTYQDYMVVFEALVPATNGAAFTFQIYSGGAFKNSGYLNTSVAADGGAPTNVASITTGTLLSWNSSTDTTFNVPSGTSGGLNGTVHLFNPSVNKLSPYRAEISYIRADNTGVVYAAETGVWNTAGAISGFQVTTNSGNINTGTIKVYGRL